MSLAKTAAGRRHLSHQDPRCPRFQPCPDAFDLRTRTIEFQTGHPDFDAHDLTPLYLGDVNSIFPESQVRGFRADMMSPCDPAVLPPGSADNRLNSPDNLSFQIQLDLFTGTNWFGQHKLRRACLESEIEIIIGVYCRLGWMEKSNTNVLDLSEAGIRED